VTATNVTRRVAAIVIADVVGYTRMMERDDTGTFHSRSSLARIIQAVLCAEPLWLLPRWTWWSQRSSRRN